MRALGDDLGVGVTMFIEGEEEVGSDTLAELLQQHRDSLAADVIVIADSGNWDIGVPALTTSLRGLVRVDVSVRTLTHAVHSGHVGRPRAGRADGADPAAHHVVRRGRVTSPSTGCTRARAADVDYPEDRLRAESGIAPGVEYIGRGSAVERLWTQPSLTITGLDAPKVDGASNTLTATARAKLSLRIAPGDTTANALDCLRAHLEQHVPFGARARLRGRRHRRGHPDRRQRSGVRRSPGRRSPRPGTASAPIDMGVGGSIPFIAEFLESFPEASVLVTGVEDPDTRAHGANEGLHLAEFERVCLAETLLLSNLAG